MFQVEELAPVAAQNDEAEVRSAALETDYLTTRAEDAAVRVAKVLLFRGPEWELPEVDFPNRTDTLVERWIDRLKAEGNRYRALILANWATTKQSDLAMYPLFLYNSRYRNSHRILEYILSGEKWAPPYLWLVVLNMLRQSGGISHDELHDLTARPFEDLAPHVNRLFGGDSVFDWLRTKKRPMRFYGGVTNTVLGLYDRLFADPEVGTQHLHRGAEVRIDLGGGFNTSEVERLVGASFVSADLMTPRLRDYDEDLVLLDNRDPAHPGRVADDASRRELLARQDAVRHLRFDVFKDRFSLDAGSYLVVSSGFMTSNLRAQTSESREIKAARLGTISTSVHAILRVVELAAAGKSVDLFTVQRASSRVFRYKTCLLQWRAGRLVRLQTTLDRRAARWTEVFPEVGRSISPENARFVSLLD